MLQEAVDILVGASVPAHTCRVFEAWPKSRLCLRWPALLGRQASYTVHEMPQVVWRRTRSFSAESDEQPGSGSDLATAAWALLGNSALDEASTCPQQKGGRQWASGGGPAVPFRQCGPVAGGNWEAFVQDCLAAKGRAVTAAELLGHGHEMSQQVCQQLSQQVGHPEGQVRGQWWGQLVDQDMSQQLGQQMGHQGAHLEGQQAGHWGMQEVGQQGGWLLGHGQQDASASSSVTSPFHSQVRLTVTHSSHSLFAR